MMGKHSIKRHRESETAFVWFYVASECTDEWQGWKRPFSMGTDIQNNKDYRTWMVRLPINKYIIIRLWRFTDKEREMFESVQFYDVHTKDINT